MLMEQTTLISIYPIDWLRNVALALCCALLIANASANASIQPGLWEITTTSDVVKRTRISPDRIQGLKDWAEQYGFDTSQIPTGEETTQVCITPQMVKSSEPPRLHDPDSGCSSQNATRNGNKYRYEFVCSSAQLNGKGAAEGTFVTPQRMEGRSEFSGTAQGVAVKEQATLKGKWMASDCGSVAPL